MKKDIKFKNDWFDCNEKKIDNILNHIKNITSEIPLSLPEIIRDVTNNFELNDTELSAMSTVLGIEIGLGSPNNIIK